VYPYALGAVETSVSVEVTFFEKAIHGDA